jgi:hypothetical protein
MTATTPKIFVRRLASLEFSNSFNPYAQRCRQYDLPDAPGIRSRALLGILESAAASELDSLWIGRDLGYRGGRRTGLAFTDDLHVAAHGLRWNVVAERATFGDPVKERTATVVWKQLQNIREAIFLWNVFPLHPHESRKPFTNRRHNKIEQCIGEELLLEIARLLNPRRVVAIGADAATMAARVMPRMNVIRVRHPSYGGQIEFEKQVRRIYSAPPREARSSSRHSGAKNAGKRIPVTRGS